MLNLDKATNEVRINLSKRGINTLPENLNVSLLLDFSGSMRSHYNNGNVSKILKRLLSISNTVDDDGLLELVLFHHEAIPCGTINVDQYDKTDSLISNFLRKYDMGGTNFAPAVYKILELLSLQVPTKPVGFFTNLFKSSKTTPTVYTPEGKQLIVLISDGENSDTSEFEDVVQHIEKLPNVYLQCIAVGYTSSYLKQIAEKSDSVGYSNLKDFSNTDNALIDSIINVELLEKFKNI